MAEGGWARIEGSSRAGLNVYCTYVGATQTCVGSQSTARAEGASHDHLGAGSGHPMIAQSATWALYVTYLLNAGMHRLL